MGICFVFFRYGRGEGDGIKMGKWIFLSFFVFGCREYVIYFLWRVKAFRD